MLTTRKGYGRQPLDIPVDSLYAAHQRALAALTTAHVRAWKFEIFVDGVIAYHVYWNGRLWEGPTIYDSRFPPREVVFVGQQPRPVQPPGRVPSDQ